MAKRSLKAEPVRGRQGTDGARSPADREPAGRGRNHTEPSCPRHRRREGKILRPRLACAVDGTGGAGGLLGYPIIRSLLRVPREREARTAFSAAAGRLGFAALRADMLRFGGWLAREAGVVPGDRVAICLPKSLEMVRALHGVMAAGAAYVGLEFRGPPARLGGIIASTAPRLLLTTPETARQLAAEGGIPALPPVLAIEAAEGGQGLEALLRGATPLADAVAVDPDDLAAIVFTSGSTGAPKGVMRTHRNLLEDVLSHLRGEGFGPEDMRPDNSGLQHVFPTLFYPAACGCRVHLMTEQDVMFPEIVTEILERERATVWGCAATALRLMIERGELGRRNLGSLRLVKSYGEALSVDLLRSVKAAFPQARVVSAYGATEAPNIARFEATADLPAGLRAVPLGRVQDHHRLELCDDSGREAAPGEIGEICTRGPSVSPGYWKDPALTAARQLRGIANSYRTGDLAFADHAGILHFAGRRDHLVKLRGHRFDLGEIEAALKRHPAVRDAVAIALSRPEGETDILAVVETTGSAGLEATLRKLCAEWLPRAARPLRVAFAEELPRLSNGKVDRQRIRTRFAPDAAPDAVRPEG